MVPAGRALCLAAETLARFLLGLALLVLFLRASRLFLALAGFRGLTLGALGPIALGAATGFLLGGAALLGHALLFDRADARRPAHWRGRCAPPRSGAQHHAGAAGTLLAGTRRAAAAAGTAVAIRAGSTGPLRLARTRRGAGAR